VDSVNSLQTFRSAALRSGLVSHDLWETTVHEVGSDAGRIAQQLVAQGVVTPYQAQQLRFGRGKLNLGPYLITDWIGQGGMGQVFKAVHTVMGRPSAVKVLPLEKSTPQSRESFLREIRLQAGLDCPFLVRAYDAGHDGNVHYLVTEYVPGTDLRRLVRQRGPLPPGAAAGVIRQAALGLNYAHGLGLIHRDVKPGNILVTPEGLAKVSDVGLAAWMGANDDLRVGKIVGTADYLSPEQIRTPDDIGPVSDLYSLGCTLYYAVTGKVPFPGGDAREKCRRHIEETPWHPRRFAPELSEELVELIAEMMDKDPRKRIASAASVAERLAPWCDEQPAGFPAVLRSSPWMAAPPPAEPAPEPGPESAGGSTEREAISRTALEDPRGEAVRKNSLPGGAGSGVSVLSPPLPPPVPAWAETERPHSVDQSLRLAQLLVVVSLISLLLGAVFGFVIGRNLE